MKLKDSYHLYAGITIVLWSQAFVFTRLALQHFSAYSLGFLRYFVASCALLIIAVAKKMKLPAKSDVKWFLLEGAAGFFIYIVAFNKGCETVEVSTASLIIATVPIMTPLLASFVYKERLKHYQWFAIAVSFSGVIMLTLMNGVLMINRGILWLLFAAMLVSCYSIIQRKLTKTYSALQTSAFSIFAGTLMLFVFSPAAYTELKNVPIIQVVYLVVLGVFPSAFAYLSWSQALAKAKYTSSVSNYMFITPFFATLSGFIIAGETPDFSTIVGGAIILSGLLFFNLGDKLFIRPSHKKIERNL